ncbi:MAG TPA: long-chain fatty acid--CoA ligase [Cryptosporangiaceae bacterium]|nr:long-chain fatty acid--CoA ligase [Cryptosporangiaceae bacterium]
MREFTVPVEYTVADGAQLTDPVWRNADEVPDLVTIRRRQDGRWQDVTAAAFRDDVVAVAKGLVAAGVEPGQRVGLMARTSYEWTLVDYATWAAGAITVPIYETSWAEQVRWILGDSGAVACVVGTTSHATVVAAVRDDLPDLGPVWTVEAGGIDALRAAGRDLPDSVIQARRAAGRAEDVATIIYTSGTTGRPKGCVLTHRNLLFDVGNALPGLRTLFRDGASTLLFLPLAHSFARLVQLGAIQARAVLGHTGEVKNLLADLASFQPTFVLSVPRVFEKVYNGARQQAHASGRGAVFDRAEAVALAWSEALDRGGPGLGLRLAHGVFDRLVYRRLRGALGGRCEAAVSGGAPLGARLGHFFRGIGVTVYEGYGLTETSPASTSNTASAYRIGTVGQPLPGVTIRIADDGEVLVRGDHVFRGYWRDPAATAEALDSEGWFHTGDLGSLDDDGFLTITGRKKELIVTTGGKNVAPAVLENRLRAHPLVSQCMVVGDGRPFVGCVVTIDAEALPAWKRRAGKRAEATVADLAADVDLRAEIQKAVDDANKAVSRAEAIREFRILPRDFTEQAGELTPSLKVRRGIVTKEYADEIAAIYA